MKPYLKNIINDLQNSDTSRIQLTIEINFITSKDAEEERLMHLTSNNINFSPYIDVNEVIYQLFESLLLRY